MRIACPICAANYEVEDALLAPGRSVRCARCSEQWVPIERRLPADAPEVAAPEVAAPEVAAPEVAAPKVAEEPPAPPPSEPLAKAPPPLTAMDRLASQPPHLPRPSTGLRVAWAASLVVLLLSGWGIVAWRADLMRAWPPSARLYGAIGLAPAPPPVH